MKQSFLHILCTGLMLIASISMAQADYPVFYDDENPTYGSVAVPEIEFPEHPTPCAPDDQACIDDYLDMLDAQLQGFMESQQPPSPVNTWREGECVLDDPSACTTYETEWQVWASSANKGELDFAQDCMDVPDSGWWMDYAYKCNKK